MSSGEDSGLESGPEENVQARGANSFLDIEAEAEDSLDDEEEEFSDNGVGQDQPQEEELYAEDPSSHLELDQQRQQEDVKRLTSLYEEKWGQQGAEMDRRYSEYGHEEFVDHASQRQPPSMRDPKLWLVKCDPGLEKEAVLKLMSKYFRYGRTPEPVFTCSAFTTPAVKGYVYVEAVKKVHVTKAIQHIRALKHWSIRLLPIEEMTQSLTIRAEAAIVKPKQWIRMKRGVYKNDLALVLATYDQNTSLDVKLIPRIDYSALEARQKNPEASKGRKRRRLVRPLRTPFNATEIQNLGGEVVHDNRGFQVYKNKRYKNGFLHVRAKISAVKIDGVNPTTEEVERFLQGSRRTNSDGEEEEAEDLLSLMPPPRKMKIDSVYLKGDRIEVIKGDMKNLTGVIIRTTKTEVILKPDKEYNIGMAKVTVAILHIRKKFENGEHIKVLHGKFKNETGLIVRVDDYGGLIVFTDVGKEEIEVTSSIVMITTEVSTGRERLGEYELYDLVEIGQGNVGCIVRVDMRSFQLLDTRGTVHTVSLQQMGQIKRSKYAVTFDSNNNQMTRDDVVRIKSGDHKGRQCTVKHVYRNWVFLYSFLYNKHSGLMVARAKHVAAVGQVGAPKAFQADATPAYQSPRHMRQSTNGGRRNNSRMNSRTRFRNDPLRNQRVVITAGSYKMMQGVVCSVTEHTARVELHGMIRTVTIPRSQLKEAIRKQEESPEAKDYYDASAGGRTPAWDMGSRTPFNNEGGMTPMTPYAGGGETPSQAPYTPSHDPWNPVTPHHADEPNPTSPRDEWDTHQSYNSWSETPTPLTPVPETPMQTPMPDTPNTSLPNPSTPFDSMGQPNSPGVPVTPYDPLNPINDPVTPYTPLPETPYDEYEGLQGGGLLPGSVVVVDGTTAVVRTHLSSDEYEVLFDDGKVSTMQGPLELMPVPVTQDGSLVIAISGDYAGQKGELLGTDSEMAQSIVQTDAGEMIFVDTKDLAVYRPLQE